MIVIVAGEVVEVVAEVVETVETISKGHNVHTYQRLRVFFFLFFFSTQSWILLWIGKLPW